MPFTHVEQGTGVVTGDRPGIFLGEIKGICNSTQQDIHSLLLRGRGRIQVTGFIKASLEEIEPAQQRTTIIEPVLGHGEREAVGQSLAAIK